MKYTTIILSCLTLNLCLVQLATARLVTVSFNPSPAEAQGLVAGYGLYYQPVNTPDPNSWIYLSCCGAGNTNIYTDTTVIIGNPVWIAGDAIGRNGIESGFSARVLFDTNVWFAALAAAAKAAAIAQKVSIQSSADTHKLVADETIPAAVGASANAVSVPAVPAAPTVNSIHALANGEIQIAGIGASNQFYTVSASTSLAAPNWVPIGPAFANGTNIVFFDQHATNYSQRFYRLSLP